MLHLFKVKVREAPYSQLTHTQTRVMIANHVSYLDVIVLLARGIPCVFLGKAQILRWPLISTIARASGMVFVDRDRLWSRAGAILDLQERLQQGMSVVIFPEGTTSLNGPRRGLTTYFSGAFRLARMEEKPVEILYLHYENEKNVAWLGESSFVSHLWNYLKNPATQVTIRRQSYGTPNTREEQRDQFLKSRLWILDAGLEVVC